MPLSTTIRCVRGVFGEPSTPGFVEGALSPESRRSRADPRSLARAIFWPSRELACRELPHSLEVCCPGFPIALLIRSAFVLPSPPGISIPTAANVPLLSLFLRPPSAPSEGATCFPRFPRFPREARAWRSCARKACSAAWFCSTRTSSGVCSRTLTPILRRGGSFARGRQGDGEGVGEGGGAGGVEGVRVRAVERAGVRAEVGAGEGSSVPVPHVLQQVTRIGKQLVVRAVRMPRQHPVLALVHLAERHRRAPPPLSHARPAIPSLLVEVSQFIPAHLGVDSAEPISNSTRASASHWL